LNVRLKNSSGDRQVTDIVFTDTLRLNTI